MSETSAVLHLCIAFGLPDFSPSKNASSKSLRPQSTSRSKARTAERREREGGRGDGGFKGRDNLETSSVEDRQLWTLFLQKVRSIQGRNLELVQLSVTQLSVWSLMVYFDSCMCCFGFWNDGFVLVSGLDWVWFVCVLIGISGTYLLRRIGICIFVYFRSPPELQKNSLL